MSGFLIMISVLKYLMPLMIGLMVGWVVNGWRLDTHYKERALQAEQTARVREQELQEINDALRTNLEKERSDAADKIAELTKRVNSGAVRLSVPTSSITVSGNTYTGIGEARCQLDASTANELIDIANTGDQAIRELNYCIDMYNAVKYQN